MPLAGGPNILGESNLVFAYDTGDTSNSYIGQPTVNTVGALNSFNPLDLYTWASSGATSTWVRDTTSKSPAGGISLRETSYGGDSYSNTYNNSGNNIVAASAGQTWTASVYALAPVGTNLQIWLFEANSNGNYVTLSVNAFTATGQWQRISVTRTFTDGTTSYAQVRVATSTTGATVLWDGLQVEQKAYPTPFVNGTRSATQGLLTLVGTDTIDLTNMSFDSNAKMLFDGTNDYVSIPTYTFGNGNWTVSMVVNANDFANFNLMSNTSGGPVTNAFGAYNTKIYYMNYDGDWQTHSGNTVLSTSTWYMLTWVNYAGATANLGTMQMFVNGISDSSIFNSYTTNGGPCNAIGANWYPSSFNGRIDAVQIYNKSLTSAEIQQNYQQYKTRFNLS